MALRLSLSKSQYIRGLQCPKSLYLHKYHPKLRNDISDEQQAVFSRGTDVGILAQKLFPGGIEIPFDGLSVAEQVEMTRKAIARKALTIYEASFLEDGIFIKVDILQRGSKGWELYEVKSATKVKPVNLDDIAMQYYVLKEAGIKISKAYLTHINSSYVRKKRISVKKLFTHADVTAEVKALQKEVPATIKNLRKMISGLTAPTRMTAISVTTAGSISPKIPSSVWLVAGLTSLSITGSQRCLFPICLWMN